MRIETHKRDVAILLGDDEVQGAVYCSECGFHVCNGIDPKEMDPNLEDDMLDWLSEGRPDGEYEQSE